MNNYKKNEEVLYDSVLSGELSIDDQGRIWRHAERRGPKRALNPVEVRRAEYANNNHGYLCIMLRRFKKQITALAHRMVWLHFYGKIPETLTVNHKNGVKTDNDPKNLELVTLGENHKHAYRILERRHPRSRLTKDDVLELRTRFRGGESVEQLASEKKLSRGGMWCVCHNRTWKHL